MNDSTNVRIQLAVKRLVDVVMSVVLLLILLPVMLVTAAAVKIASPGPIVFTQRRAGRDGRLFTIYKFRSMTQEASQSERGTRIYEDDSRITSVGKVLRATSLDELPQLFNVLKGEMSFVGPRPDLPHHVEKYTPFQRQRLTVRPGITGWAQISGRNELTWEERIRLDVGYLQNWSLVRDLNVLIRTLAVVLSRKGVAVPRNVGNPSAGKGEETH